MQPVATKTMDATFAASMSVYFSAEIYMTDDPTIEQEIRDVPANEKSAIALSNQLFKVERS